MKMDVINDLSQLSPGFLDQLDQLMGPAGDSCGYLPPPDARRIGSHQLPESPPDSGSENPYSPSDTIAHSIPVSQSVLNQDYMLVQDHIQHEILQQNGEYMYEELKSDSLDHDVLRNNLNDVVVLPQDANLMELGLRSVRHDIGLNDYQNRYGQMRVEMPELDQGIMNPQLLSIGHEPLTPAFTSLQEPSSKKRKHSSDVNSQVKCEPAVLSPESLSPLQGGSAPRAAPSVDGSEASDEAPFQCIRFASFQQTPWHCLYDQHLKPLTPPSYVVGADKGFNFSQIDEAFVCQKKNHFQVTCQIHMQGDAHYVKAGDGAKKINSFYLHFYGVKAEDPSQEVRVEQSQSDRTKKPFHPVPVELRREGTKLTVGRLHFAETTNNNMRKKGRPNPDQRHFQLVVALKAHCQHTEYMIAAAASDKIIVRASNPGQFESDCTENWWQRGVLDNSVHFNGRVGINTDRPDESCVINGNLKVMGHIIQPSDARAKHNIEELDTAQQLKNVQSIRVVKFNYDPSFAEHSGLLGFDPRSSAPSSDTGVIAQEVKRIIPEAVKEAGDVTLPDGNTIYKFLFVNKDRIFMENIGAVKELCKVTGKLESRIDQLERTNKKLCKISVLQRRDSARSSISNDSRYSAASSTCKSMYSDGNISNEHIRDIARNIRKHEYCHKLSHNSPKYTRKQCKCCKEHHPHKYGKHYNANKTNTVRYHSSKHDMESPDNMHFSPNFDTLASNKTRESAVQPTENYSTMTKSKDTCLWVKNRERENSFVCGNTNFGFCCRKKDKMYGDGGVELISNKFLQIVITVLIFIMAVCLVVMSVLYFKEHQELVSIKDMRLRSHSTLYASNYGKFANMHTPPPRATPPGPDSGYPNQIQNSKHSQHVAAKKTAKEKGTHKTTPEYITAPPIVTPPQTTPLHASKNYVKNGLNMDPQSPPIPHVEHRLSISRDAEVVGSGCALENVLNAELDADCQSSCNLDPPQAYDNQEPLEKTNQDKEFNETSNFARAIDPLPNERPPVVRMIEERNNTDAYKSENDSLKKQLHDEINIAESNFLDPSKIILLSDNVTKNETPRRLKRVAGDAKGSSRSKRETNEALLRSSSEEMFLTEQSDEIGGMKDCDKVSFGVKSKTFANESMFEETICANAFSNLTYIVPVSKCLREKNIIIGFKSSKLRQLRLCNLQCKYDTTKGCQMNRDIARPQAEKDGAWTSRMTLECNMDREMTVRAAFVQQKDLCYLTSDQKVPFVEYNIRIFRDCRN